MFPIFVDPIVAATITDDSDADTRQHVATVDTSGSTNSDQRSTSDYSGKFNQSPVNFGHNIKTKSRTDMMELNVEKTKSGCGL